SLAHGQRNRNVSRQLKHPRNRRAARRNRTHAQVQAKGARPAAQPRESLLARGAQEMSDLLRLPSLPPFPKHANVPQPGATAPFSLPAPQDRTAVQSDAQSPIAGQSV